MDLKEQKILKRRVSHHWYYRSKYLALSKFIERMPFMNILDVGAGHGFFSKQLLRATDASSAVCVDTGYPEETKETYFGKKIEFRKTIPFSSADLVLLMDVLEHVQDDAALVRECREKVRSGTMFVITVPAFQCLFSRHDVFLGHCRRYSRKQLEKVLRSAGLEIVRSNYFFLFVLFCASLKRFFHKIQTKYLLEESTPSSDLKMRGKFVNGLMIQLNKLEFLLLRNNKLAGLSIFCLARKI